MAIKTFGAIQRRGNSLKKELKLTERDHDRIAFTVPPLHDLLICT